MAASIAFLTLRLALATLARLCISLARASGVILAQYALTPAAEVLRVLVTCVPPRVLLATATFATVLRLLVDGLGNVGTEW